MPAMLTNAEFIAAVQALSVTGVARKYGYPPESIDLADGYITFLAMPNMVRGQQVSTCIGQSKQRDIGYVMVLEATGQSTQAEKYALIAAALDNLETALDSLAPATVNFVEYSIGVNGNFPIGDSQYLALEVALTAHSL